MWVALRPLGRMLERCAPRAVGCEARAVASSAAVLRDIDPQETQEWLEALEAVVRSDGPERAQQLLEIVLERARASGVPLEVGLNTPYVNTIAPEREERCPGDLDLEHRIRSLIRWNAIATV